MDWREKLHLDLISNDTANHICQLVESEIIEKIIEDVKAIGTITGYDEAISEGLRSKWLSKNIK